MVGLPDLIKIIISLGLIAPVAFFMGMPFPLGLGRLTRKKSDLVPWAWGINGCASVISSVLATVIAVSWGERKLASESGQEVKEKPDFLTFYSKCYIFLVTRR